MSDTKFDWLEHFERNTWDNDRIQGLEIPKDKFLVDGLIPKGCTFLSGAPKSFKSYITLHIIDCLSTGKKVFGHFEVSRKRKVMVMDRENQLWATKERINQVTDGVNKNIQYLQVMDSFEYEEFQDRFIHFLEMQGTEVLIMDSYRRFYLDDENSSGRSAKFFTFVKKIQDSGVSTIFIHHFNKNSDAKGSARIRGSSDIVAFYDANINFEKENNSGNISIKLEQTECRMGKEINPFVVNVVEGEEEDTLDFVFEMFLDPDIDRESKLKQEIVRILKANGKNMLMDEFEKRLGREFGMNLIKKTVRHMEKSQKIFSEPINKYGKKAYFYGTDLFREAK